MARAPLGDITNDPAPITPLRGDHGRRLTSSRASGALKTLAATTTPSGQRRRRSLGPSALKAQKKCRLSITKASELHQNITEAEVSAFLLRQYGKQARPFQTATAVSIYDGRSTFVVAGTGAGKSLAYWGLLARDNAVLLVLCPLNRLMKEQVTFFLLKQYIHRERRHED